MHEQYNDDNYSNDIALLLLKQRVNLGEDVNVACLPQIDEPLVGDCWVTGWGTLKEDGKQPTILQKVKVHGFFL